MKRWEGMMAAVHENQLQRHHRRGRKKEFASVPLQLCSGCQKETRWLSVEGTCWDCTIQTSKNKVPLNVGMFEEDDEGSDNEVEILEGW
jgi:hypothetical protein